MSLVGLAHFIELTALASLSYCWYGTGGANAV